MWGGNNSLESTSIYCDSLTNICALMNVYSERDLDVRPENGRERVFFDGQREKKGLRSELSRDRVLHRIQKSKCRRKVGFNRNNSLSNICALIMCCSERVKHVNPESERESDFFCGTEK